MKSKLNTQPSTVNRQLSIVIVADGKFPEHEIPLRALADADIVVCCDGAATKVDLHGIIPTAIVGDLDSVEENRNLPRIHLIPF